MPALRRLLRALLDATLSPLLALLLMFEEWGWAPLARLMARLARLPLLAQLERLIARLPPVAALLVFALPALALLPVKLLALYWIGQGHALAGLGVIVAAKIAGTAVVARLFTLTRPALMRLAWFARGYRAWKRWKDALMARVRRSRPWRRMRALARRIRAQLRRLLAP